MLVNFIAFTDTKKFILSTDENMKENFSNLLTKIKNRRITFFYQYELYFIDKYKKEGNNFVEKKVREQLFELAEEKYKMFLSKLLPNVNNIVGVRLPTLRKIA
ncbi:MAG: hypothetical protein ACRC5H_08565, partial [Treponemataceae bacterium]